MDFVRRHAVVTRDWERFHADYDNLREGLVACDGSALQAKRGEFAISFGEITQRARALPRPTVRDLADKLIEALEGEERALRNLRDNWQPGDTELFEEVDME